MNEYDLKKSLGKRSEKQNNNSAAPRGINGIPNSVLTEVFAGKRKATNEMMGHRSDLAPSIAAKMNQAFGMDFSAVQIYHTDAMNGTGMRGIAQGNKVVLSSDVDLNTMEGQAVLGHELSHIRVQSMGIGTGNGLLQNAALEHQADNEGLLAAHGQNIYGESMGMSMGLGMAGFEGLTPLSGGMSATAAAPMQANKLTDWFFGKKKVGGDADAKIYENEDDDFVNSEEGLDFARMQESDVTDEERVNFSNNQSTKFRSGLNPQELDVVDKYIETEAEPYKNVFLGKPMKNKSPEEIEKYKNEASQLNEVLHKQQLPALVPVFRGVTDISGADLLKTGLPKGLFDPTKGFRSDILDKMSDKQLKKLSKKRQFSSNTFTSTTLSDKYAQNWAANNQKFNVMNGEANVPTEKIDEIVQKGAEDPGSFPGVHELKFNLPKGTHGAFIDNTQTEGDPQMEYLLPPGTKMALKEIQRIKDKQGNVIPQRFRFIMEVLEQQKKELPN